MSTCTIPWKRARHKALALSVAAILIAAALTGGTLAYFTGQTRTHNVITSGGVDIALFEKGAGGVDFPETLSVMPGTQLEDVITVQNTGSDPAWVRVRYEVTLAPDSQYGAGLSDEAIQKAATDYVTLAMTNNGWVKGEGENEGWYLYNAQLAPDATTTAFSEALQFSPNMGNEFQKSQCSLRVYAQATQVANNGTTVQEAAGWPTQN